MKIIFNADDFGYSQGVNYGIIDAFVNGVVRSTTIMPNGVGFGHAVQLSRQYDIKVGIHLTLSTGKSIGTHKCITDTQGNFCKLLQVESMAAESKIDLDEVNAEFELQIRKVLDAGIQPTHFDSHHHVHMLQGVDKVVQELATKYQVGLRGSSTDKYSSEFYADDATLECVKSIISNNASAKSIEIMCHPAYVDVHLLKTSGYNTPRVRELDILTSIELKSWIQSNDWSLASYLKS
ncbi:MAG: chitin disaccharide deacetylase [Clostridiales bacterium]|jgi:predicted glycoside hydrolase/deacetylase ChbG (UPF0249 family)|nr:chitin disaccharide deacetylase [Clostridiales bacterium]